MLALFTVSSLASCPDPEEIHPQKRTNIEQPRWITDSGWISDAVSHSKDIGYIGFVRVSIIHPDDLVHALICEYTTAYSGGFNMREPFLDSLVPILIADISDRKKWLTNVVGVTNGYTCFYNCEFEFGHTINTNTDKLFRSPFDGKP